MAKKRICIFTEAFGVGGIEAFISGIVCNLPRDDFEIDIVASKIERGIYTEALAPLSISFTELSGRLRFGGNFRKFAKLLSERNYDCIHFNLFQGAALGFVRIAERAGVKNRVVHAHGAGLRGGILRPLKLLVHKIGRALYLGYATERLACSEQAGKFLFGSSDGVKIIKNGIDTKRFAFSEEKRRQAREALGVKDELLAISVGRLSSEKNPIFTIRVFSELKKMRSDAKLVIAGEGPLSKECEKTIDKLGMSDSVTMLGSIREADKLLMAADVFLMPSVSEGLGIALIEAQSTGVRAVVSDRIPLEAIINEAVTRLDLKAPLSVWAKAAEAISGDKYRHSAYLEVKKAGYDISDTAKQMSEIYSK